MNNVSDDVYLLAAKILASTAATMSKADDKIHMNPSGAILSVRQVLQWAVSAAGRKALADKPDVRDNLFALAVRFV